MPTLPNSSTADAGNSGVGPPLNTLSQWFYNNTGGAQAAQTRNALAQQAQDQAGSVVSTPSATMGYVQNRLNALNDWGSQQAAAMRQPVYDHTAHQLTDNGQQVANLVSGFAGGDGLAEAAFPSEAASFFNPPSLPQRSFYADYPGGLPADSLGRLTHDMHGQPLVAPYVAGRKMAGGPDVPIPPDAFGTIAQNITGNAPQAVPMQRMGGNAIGEYALAPSGGQVSYYEGLSQPVAQQVIGHETGHVIDEMAGQIPTDGLHDELARVYNAGRNPDPSQGMATPMDQGYSAAAAPREQMAEAVRAYMTDPNSFKTVAPRTADAIRSRVNVHPTLSRYVQFNSLAPLAGVGLAGAGAMMRPQQNALMPQEAVPR